MAFRRVGDRHADGGELIAQAICSLEVPGGAGALPLLEQDSCGHRQIEMRSAPVEVQPEDLVPSKQKARLVDSWQARAHDLSHQRHRSGKVEVVGERGSKASLEFISLVLAGRSVSAGPPIGQPIAQVREGAVRAGQSFRAEVQLGPVLRLQRPRRPILPC